MITFTASLAKWKTPLFSDVLQADIQRLSIDQLFLQQALQYGSHATTDNMKLMMLKVVDDDVSIYAKVGVFFNSVMSGCQCDDDPNPMNVEVEYCELIFTINKKTAETDIALSS